MSFDVKTRLSKLKNSAKNRDLNINLNINKYQVLIDSGCHFCGIELSDQNGYCLDRIDSSKGYIISNVVACCKICNRAKSDMNVHDFINWLQKANNHMQEQINFHKKLMSLGITEEMYIQIEEEFYKEQNKNKEKCHLKVVNKK